jgi:hypothetical protein
MGTAIIWDFAGGGSWTGGGMGGRDEVGEMGWGAEGEVAVGICTFLGLTSL